jgi:hypothetical protein
MSTSRKLRESQAAEWCRLLQLWKDHATLRREQMSDHEVGLIPQELAAGQNENNIADHSLTCKSYWAQWRSLIVRDLPLDVD